MEGSGEGLIINSFDCITNLIIPLFIEFVGAFFGFMSAIYLSEKDSRDKRKELSSSLTDELGHIKIELEERLKVDANQDDFYRYPTQIWDINTRSGALNGMPLSEYKKFTDIYSKIEFAQEIEREWSHSKMLVGYDDGGASGFQKNYIAALNMRSVSYRQEMANDR